MKRRKFWGWGDEGPTAEQICGGGQITCRVRHAYPDGPAPSCSVVAPGRPESLVQQWDEIKAAAEALRAHGGTKGALHPAGVLNPGVMIDPHRDLLLARMA